jgi:hypothetical protein
MNTKQIIKQALKKPELYSEGELAYIRLVKRERKIKKQERKVRKQEV